MNLIYKNLTIRNAAPSDAEQLCAWWNDGAVMAHAGFPNGVGCKPEEIRASLAQDTDETHRRHIIEAYGKPIGEMVYRNKGCTAELGIKICDFSAQEKGYGTTLLAMFIDALFKYYGFEKALLDTNLKNERAQHVYEHKLGFCRAGLEKDSWRDQLGELQSTVNFVMDKGDWPAPGREVPRYIFLRREAEADFRTVEELTREAFWLNSATRPVIDEPLLARNLRGCQDFVPQLDYVALMDGKIVGNVMFSKAKVARDSGDKLDVLSFGPLSVLPERQNQGVGRALMAFTIAEARRLGHSAILFFGHPDYYPRLGFRRAAEFGITTANGRSFDAFMAMELCEGALGGAGGRFIESPVFNLDENEALEFEKTFPPKDKASATPVEALLSQLELRAAEAINSLGFQWLDELRGKSQREIMAIPGIDVRAIETIHRIMNEHGRRWGEG